MIVCRSERVPGAKDLFEIFQNHSEYGIGIAKGSWEQSAIIKLSSIGISVENVAFSNCNQYKTRSETFSDTIGQLKNRISDPVKDIVYFGDGI